MAGRVNELQVNWFFQDDKGFLLYMQPYWLSVDNFFQAIMDSFHPSKISMYRDIFVSGLLFHYSRILLFFILIILNNYLRGMHSLWLQS